VGKIWVVPAKGARVTEGLIDKALLYNLKNSVHTLMLTPRFEQ
jgi:hypothetical protein